MTLSFSTKYVEARVATISFDFLLLQLLQLQWDTRIKQLDVFDWMTKFRAFPGPPSYSITPGYEADKAWSLQSEKRFVAKQNYIRTGSGEHDVVVETKWRLICLLCYRKWDAKCWNWQRVYAICCSDYRETTVLFKNVGRIHWPKTLSNHLLGTIKRG